MPSPRWPPLPAARPPPAQAARRAARPPQPWATFAAGLARNSPAPRAAGHDTCTGWGSRIRQPAVRGGQAAAGDRDVVLAGVSAVSGSSVDRPARAQAFAVLAVLVAGWWRVALAWAVAACADARRGEKRAGRSGDSGAGSGVTRHRGPVRGVSQPWAPRAVSHLAPGSASAYKGRSGVTWPPPRACGRAPNQPGPGKPLLVRPAGDALLIVLIVLALTSSWISTIKNPWIPDTLEPPSPSNGGRSPLPHLSGLMLGL